MKESEGKKSQKILFYLSSFIPLYLLLFIQNIQIRDKDGLFILKEFFSQFFNTSTTVLCFWAGLLLLSLLSLFGIFLFFLVYTKTDGRISEIKDTEFVKRGYSWLYSHLHCSVNHYGYS